jgi:hypothetical protein
VADEPMAAWDDGALRALVPRVLAGLVRRGEQFDAAEDALQEALLEALRVWPEHPPRDPRAWLTTVATRRLVDARRSETARHRREEEAGAEPRPEAARRATNLAERDHLVARPPASGPAGREAPRRPLSASRSAGGGRWRQRLCLPDPFLPQSFFIRGLSFAFLPLWPVNLAVPK